MVQLLNTVGLWPMLGTALPLLVALFTKRETKSGIQGVLFALLAALGGIAEEQVRAITNHAVYDWKAALLSAAGAWVLGQAAHSSLWKPTGIAALLQRFGSRVSAVENAIPSNVRASLAEILAAGLNHLENEAVGKHAAVAAPVTATATTDGAKVAAAVNSIGFALPDPEKDIPEEYPLEGDDAYPPLSE